MKLKENKMSLKKKRKKRKRKLSLKKIPSERNEEFDNSVSSKTSSKSEDDHQTCDCFCLCDEMIKTCKEKKSVKKERKFNNTADDIADDASCLVVKDKVIRRTVIGA